MGLTTENNDMTIEESFAALDEMIQKLENDQVSLEESFKLYQEGMGLLKNINEKIDGVEKKMQIMDDAGRTEDFT